MRLSTTGPFPFLLARALVEENGADCTAAVTEPSCGDGRRAKVSWHTRETLGRAGVSDMGIRKTFARLASAGDRERIVMVYGVCKTRRCARCTYGVNNSLMAESCPPWVAARLALDRRCSEQYSIEVD